MFWRGNDFHRSFCRDQGDYKYVLHYYLSGASSGEEDEVSTSNEHVVHVFVGLTGGDLSQNTLNTLPAEITSFLDTVLLRDDQGKVTANMKQMFNKAIEQYRTIDNLCAFVSGVLRIGQRYVL